MLINNQSQQRKLTSGKTKGTGAGTHERQVPAEQRVAEASGCLQEEHWPVAVRRQEEGSLGAGPREGPQEYSPGVLASPLLVAAR